MNLPNKLTVLRFLITIVYFIILSFYDSSDLTAESTSLLKPALFLFIVAALTDFFDGYLARRYQSVTKFGRISDPLIDKIIICGSFIFFAGWNNPNVFLPAWIVVVIVAREFLVSGLRGLMESQGIPFASTVWGKQKMLCQTITIIWCLFYLGYPGLLIPVIWSAVILQALIWVTLVLTVLSGLVYFLQVSTWKEISRNIL